MITPTDKESWNFVVPVHDHDLQMARLKNSIANIRPTVTGRRLLFLITVHLR